MRLKQLIKVLNPHLISSQIEDFEVKGISCDSKRIGEDFIFVAIKGTQDDGHQFIQEAQEKGAKAFVVRRSSFVVRRLNKALFIKVNDTRKALAKLAAEFYGNPSSEIKVVGVTGTNGKTTVTYLIEMILKEAHFNPAVIGTINYRFKDKVLPAKNTTPAPIEMQSLLSEMVKERINYALIEVSSHALSQERTAGINFHAAIFTNLTQDHLDYHKNTSNYFQAKAKLFKNINPHSFVVVNHDDKYGRKIEALSPAEVVTYGIKNTASVMAKDVKLSIAGIEFLLIAPQGKIVLRSHLFGLHNVYNILASVAWALKEGLDLSLIKSAIEKFNLVPGRLEKIDFAGPFSVFVDYAHTEDALKNAIRTLRQISSCRIIVVFGCGGQRDKTKRPRMGRVVSELADFAIITNDNPRGEDPQRIIDEIKKGIRKDNYCVIPDRWEAIRKSISLAKAGDIVLVAGKGHEHYQILKDKTIAFDDREVIRTCLRSVNY